MGSRVHIALACALLGLLLGCSGKESLWLLDLSRVENRVLEPGEALEFSGRGFPAGRTGELSLRGELLAPGSKPRTVSWSLRSEARSAERVSAVLDAETLQEVQGHVSFSGTATLRFAVNDRLTVAGQLKQVRIEWAGEDRLDGARLAAASNTLESLGIRAVEPDGESVVRVASVAAGSAAARRGIRAGDSIELANDFPVRSVADVAQHPSTELLRLTLRDSVQLARTVELELPQGQGLAAVSVRYLLWACPVALALLFLGPWPRPVELLRAALARVQSRPLALFRLSEVTAQVGPLSIVTSAALCCLAVWQASNLSLTAALAFYVSLLLLRSWSVAQVGPAVLLSLALLCAAVLSGGTGLAALAADQGSLPWGWTLFSRPPAWLAAFVWWQCASRLHSTPAGSRAHAWLDDASRVLLAALTASAFLGGAGGSSSSPWPALQLGVDSALFAVKTLAVLWMLALLQPRAAVRLRVVAGTLAASATLIGLWLWAMPSRAFELRVGMAVLVTLALAALAALFDYAWSRRRATGAAAP